MKLTLAGVSHHKAPIELRERVALDLDACRALAQRLGGEAVVLSTCNRTEQKNAVTCKIAEHLLRQRRRRRGDRSRALVDRSLHPNPLAGVQRLPEEPVEEGARCPGFERRPHLAENLSLARNERVEPGGDTKEMERRCLVAQAIQRSRQIVGPVAGQPCERVDRLAVEPLSERSARVEIQRDALAQLDRSSVMRHAGQSQLHEAKWVSGRTIATRTNPARLRSAPRRPRQPSCRRTSSTV